MSYTTIMDLQEKLKSDLLGSEYLLITDPDQSYKASLNTINEVLLELSASEFQQLTNKVIDDVTNFVHANAIHFYAKAVQTIPKGAPIKMVQNSDELYVYVDIAGDNDVVIGIAEQTFAGDSVGAIMSMGVLTGIDTTQFNEGDFVYSAGGGLTNVRPSVGRGQLVGYVINVGNEVEGKLLVSTSGSDAYQIVFNNANTNIQANNVQDAIIEVDNRVNSLEEIVFQQATAPTIEQGASDGDIWMDTTTNTLNVYREYPIGTGVYRWEPLLYKWDDVVDGGSW